MNRFCKSAWLILALGLLALAGCAKQDAGGARIQDFLATDVPYDDGTGVMLKWRPLDKSQRIIYYNVYRGYCPDSLFYLSRIEVDPKIGVASEWLTFYDKDYLSLIEFETAPAKLRLEKDQVAGGTLFKAVPRDAEVLGKLIPHYDVQSEIKTSKYFKDARRIELDSGEEEVFAGYELFMFDNIYASPIAGKTYYYCVVPVTETGRFLPATSILPVTPINNRPDSTAVLHTTYLKDTGEFRFEWSPPLASFDIVGWEAWLMPKRSLPFFEKDQAANFSSPDSVFQASWQKDSILLHTMEPAYWSRIFYDKARVDPLQIVLPDTAALGDHVPVLVYTDYWASPDGSTEQYFQSAALGEPIAVKTSANLPRLPDYSVLDKPNDKGDNLIISYGRPYAFVTQAVYANQSRTKLRVNYDISGNGHQEIDKLRFRFLDSGGRFIGEVEEDYPNKTINFKPSTAIGAGDGFSVEIFSRLVGEKDYASDPVSQEIVYDPSTLRYNGGRIFYQGGALNGLYYDVFSKSRLDAEYSPGMRGSALSRMYGHTIPFPDYEYPMILGYDPQTGLLLTDHHFEVALDQETNVTFIASLFRKDFEDYMAGLEAQILDLEEKTASRDTLSDDFQNLAQLRGERDLIQNHPAYRKARSAKNDKAWRGILRREAEKNSRTYAYHLLATDGRGLWSGESDLPEPRKAGPAGDTWYYPKGDWFDMTKLATLIATLIMGAMVVYAIIMTRRREMYIRPIAGLQELDNAVGRATEMGRPVMFVPGWGTLGEPCTISAMMILHQLAKKTAEYDIRLISPHVDYFVVPLAQEMVQQAYNEMGRPDAYDQNDIFFVSDVQFAFCAAVNGITVRDRVATIFYMGYFYAEALIMTEVGNQSGTVQIAGSDAITQIPFFITTCDYTLIGEEFYAASAYLSRNVELVSMLKAQDYFKVLIVIGVLVGTALSTAGINALLNFLPVE